MDTTTILITLGVVVALAITAVAVWRAQKSRRLQRKFGAEYSRTVEDAGDQRRAEVALAAREKRVRAMEIRPLSGADRARFVEAWRRLQAEFVDNPKRAIVDTDRLLGEVMATRGYPVADFEQRSEDLSVDHPEVVENYRTAHDIALAHERGQASTEDLRQAMIHFRALFDDLVGEPTNQRANSGSHQENSHVRR
jgi:FtsZ-interacting cell division protein ZipA